MRSILIIALNDLRSVARERGTLISLFGVPIAMTIVLGLALGNNNSGPAGTIYVVRPVPDALGAKFADLLRAEAGSAYIVCDIGDATNQPAACNFSNTGVAPGATVNAQRTLVEDRIKNNVGVHPVAVAIPDSFSADLDAGNQVGIDYLAPPGLNATQVSRQIVDAVLTKLNAALAAARIVTDQAAPAADQRAALYGSIYQTAISTWEANPVTIQDQIAGETQGGANLSNGFAQSAPGIGAMFVLSSVLGLSVVFITERQNWTLQRLMLMPIARWQLLAGKLLGRYVLGAIVFATMLAIGTEFGVRWGDLAGLALIVLAYVLAVTAIALAFSTLVRSRAQAAGISLLLTLTLSPLGGAWWPLDIVPDWMRTIGHLSPIAWSQDAFATLLYHNGHLVDVLPAVGVLLVFAIAFFAFGLSRFKYE